MARTRRRFGAAAGGLLFGYPLVATGCGAGGGQERAAPGDAVPGS